MSCSMARQNDLHPLLMGLDREREPQHRGCSSGCPKDQCWTAEPYERQGVGSEDERHRGWGRIERFEGVLCWAEEIWKGTQQGARSTPALDVTRTITGWWTVPTIPARTRRPALREGKGRRRVVSRRTHRRRSPHLLHQIPRWIPRPSLLIPTSPHSMTRARSVICSLASMRLPRSPLIQASGYWTLELLRT